ncbi:MAG: protein kinase domain-containing protein [Kofleriaceae bacterium]
MSRRRDQDLDAGSEGGDPSVEPDADSNALAFLRAVAHVADREPPPGEPGTRVLGGRFELGRKLGAGGFGVVYEAIDQARNAIVALKVMRHRDPGALYLLKREFRALAEIVHPNLVQLYELHSDGDAWWFTMERVLGDDAASYARPPDGRGPLDETRARHLLRELAGGLAFLHERGKLHRDIKPSNVMVARDGRVLLLDFGLVADLGDEPTSELAGTRAYMAPELASGIAPEPAADWYAVGIMLYELLAGRLPFTGDREAMRAAKLAGAPARPSELAPVPPDLERLCLDLLAPEPSWRPAGPEVVARLAPKSTPPPLRRARRSTPLVGRDRERAILGEALASARAGRAVVALVHGTSGVGKTALLHHFVDDGARAGALVLAGRCFAQESVPYKALDSIVDALCRWLRELPAAQLAALLPDDIATLARLFPVLLQLPGVSATPAPEADLLVLRRRAFGVLRELLARIGHTRTPVLVLDDLQWGDLDGIAMLVDVLRPPHPPPLLVVATYRSGDPATSPALAALLENLRGELAHAVDVRDVAVHDLEPAAAEALAHALLASASPARAATIAAATHGNPFFITELCHSSHPSLDARDDDLEAMLGARIERLPAGARRLLEIVALAGRPLPRALAAAAAFDEDLEHEPQMLALLRVGRLLRAHPVARGEDLSPYHDRIRHVAVARLAPAARAERHLRIARALEANGAAEPEQLVVHLREAGCLREAARYACEAAVQARQALAFERAARLYREALGAGAWTPSERSALLAPLGDVLAAAGRPREAAEAYLESAAAASPGDALARRRRAMEQLLLAGYTDDGLDVLDGVLRDVGMARAPALPVALASLALHRLMLAARGTEFRERAAHAISERELLRIDTCWTAAIGLTLRNPFEAADFHARHLLLALRAGEPNRIARALAMEAYHVAFRGDDPDRAAQLGERATQIAGREARPESLALVDLASAASAAIRGELSRALPLLRRSHQRFAAQGVESALERDLSRVILAACLFRAGELRELRATVEDVLADARERGNRHCQVLLEITGSALIELVADRPDRAELAVQRALDAIPATGRRARGALGAESSVVRFRAVQARAWIALYAGRPGDALRLLAASYPAMLASGLLSSRSLRTELLHCRAAAALSSARGRWSATQLLASRALGQLEGEGAWGKAIAAALRAHLDVRAGRRHEALSSLAWAHDNLHGMGMRLFARCLERRRGEWLGGEAGAALVAETDAWMAEQGIARPSRLVAMLLGSDGRAAQPEAHSSLRIP